MMAVCFLLSVPVRKMNESRTQRHVSNQIENMEAKIRNPQLSQIFFLIYNRFILNSFILYKIETQPLALSCNQSKKIKNTLNKSFPKW